MKNIAPIQIWQNGELKTATVFNLNIWDDNLATTAYFKYQLFNESIIPVEYSEDTQVVLTQVAQGNLTMSGIEYQNWDSDPSANEFAYDWAAIQLNLTIIP